MEPKDLIEVMQADRERAMLIMVQLFSPTSDEIDDFRSVIWSGKLDDHFVVQAFACHRIASIAAARPLLFAEAAGVCADAAANYRETLRNVPGVIAIESAAATAELLATAIRTAGSKSDGAGCMTADEERAAIVAWLRGQTGIHPNNPGLAILKAARAIEAGEHLARAHRQVGEGGAQ